MSIARALERVHVSVGLMNGNGLWESQIFQEAVNNTRRAVSVRQIYYWK